MFHTRRNLTRAYGHPLLGRRRENTCDVTIIFVSAPTGRDESPLSWLGEGPGVRSRGSETDNNSYLNERNSV